MERTLGGQLRAPVFGGLQGGPDKDGKNSHADTSESMDLKTLVRGHRVTSVGRFASMSREQFLDVIETLGGKYTNAVNGIGAGVRRCLEQPRRVADGSGAAGGSLGVFAPRARRRPRQR